MLPARKVLAGSLTIALACTAARSGPSFEETCTESWQVCFGTKMHSEASAASVAWAASATWGADTAGTGGTVAGPAAGRAAGRAADTGQTGSFRSSWWASVAAALAGS